MSALHAFLLSIGGACAAIVAVFHKYYYQPDTENMPTTPAPKIAPPAAIPAPAPVDPDSIEFPWDTDKHNYHNVRVLCDKAGLSVADKNTICQCIYQESNFLNYYAAGAKAGKPVSHPNLNKDGSLSSTDWGLCQINDTPKWYIGPGLTFASVADVLAHPETAAGLMIAMFKEGLLDRWDSYKSGAYKKWGVSTSPMWLLGD